MAADDSEGASGSATGASTMVQAELEIAMDLCNSLMSLLLSTEHLSLVQRLAQTLATAERHQQVVFDRVVDLELEASRLRKATHCLETQLTQLRSAAEPETDRARTCSIECDKKIKRSKQRVRFEQPEAAAAAVAATTANGTTQHSKEPSSNGNVNMAPKSSPPSLPLAPSSGATAVALAESSKRSERVLKGNSSRDSAVLAGQAVNDWAEETARHPAPPFGLENQVIKLLVSEWSKDLEKQLYLNYWLMCAAQHDTAPPGFPPGLQLVALAPEVKDGFLTLVVPILRRRPGLNLTVFSRQAVGVHAGLWDLRLRIDMWAQPPGAKALKPGESRLRAAV